jgi:hypothetical protein
MPARLTGQAAVGAVLAVLEAVVAVQLGLVVLGEAPVGLHAGGVLDLLLAVGHLDAVAGVLGLSDTKAVLAMNIPPVTVAHSGWPVSSSR